jgi:hypothetical protein
MVETAVRGGGSKQRFQVVEVCRAYQRRIDDITTRGARRQISITRFQSITPSPQAQPTGVPVTFPRSESSVRH